MKQRFHADGDKFHVETFDNVQNVLDSARLARDMGLGKKDHGVFLGRIPKVVLHMWLKESGLEMHDTEAVNDMIQMRLLSGDFDKFRVYEGRV